MKKTRRNTQKYAKAHKRDRTNKRRKSDGNGLLRKKGREKGDERMEVALHPKSEIDARIKRLQREMGDMTGAILFQSLTCFTFQALHRKG